MCISKFFLNQGYAAEWFRSALQISWQYHTHTLYSIAKEILVRKFMLVYQEGHCGQLDL